MVFQKSNPFPKSIYDNVAFGPRINGFRGDLDELFAFREKAPGMPYAHPTVEHFTPLFVTLGASLDPEQKVETKIDGYFMGLAKRSIQVA